LYEALALGRHGGTSLAGRLNELSPLAPPTDVAYHWPTVANSALGSIVRALLPTAPEESRMAIDALERNQATATRALLPRGIYARSARHGCHVLEARFAGRT
jgi:hypothetical protein